VHIVSITLKNVLLDHENGADLLELREKARAPGATILQLFGIALRLWQVRPVNDHPICLGLKIGERPARAVPICCAY